MADTPVVLVPVDGSEQSMQTVAYLCKFLSPVHTGIELFHVETESPEPFFDLGELEDTAGFKKEIGQWRSDRTLRINQFMEKARTLLLEAGFPSDHVSATIQPRRVGVARDIMHRATLRYAAVAIGRQSRNILPLFMLGGGGGQAGRKNRRPAAGHRGRCARIPQSRCGHGSILIGP